MSTSIESIAIGDELLTGRIADTHSRFVAQTLYDAGFRLARTTVIPDADEVILQTLREVGERARVAIVFGGLGPTSDDRTAACVASALQCGLVEYAPARAWVEALYKDRKRPITASTMKQVLYPEKARPLPNAVGAAPGFCCDLGRCRFYFLPGVPKEMEHMWKNEVVKDLLGLLGVNGGMYTRSWRCLGIWESQLQDRMDPIEKKLPAGAFLGYRTRFPENHLTLYLSQSIPGAQQIFESTGKEIAGLLQDYTYTETLRELEDLIVERLRAMSSSISLAESATGGLVTHRLSGVPLASEVLWGGLVTYQTRAKKAVLGLDLPSDEAAVSAFASRELALRTRAQSGTKIAAAVTGYSGPTGGTPTDPVGTFYLCVVADQTYEKRIELGNRTRLENAWGASTFLLQMVWNAIR